MKMFRTVLCTSRRLVRRQINTFVPVVLQRQCYVRTLNSSCSTPVVHQFSTISDKPQSSDSIEPAVFEEICNETLESLCEYFEEIVDQAPNLKGADITFSDGVLTVALGNSYGTYVINRQTPNKQIWLSSPVSGPKRYNLVLENGGYWVYKHDGVTLHRLLQEEISKVVKHRIEFKNCSHSSD